ncbi:MAG: hypothetical protein WC547_07475 [Candidatus Omnitrophota bacterium]
MRALTLMELIIALVLFSLMILGIANIEIFCKHAFMGTDRKTRIMNEAAYVVEHMSKYIAKAVGDAKDFPVSDEPIAGCDDITRVWTDYNENGVRDAGDMQIVYCFNSTSHTMDYYPGFWTWPEPFTDNPAYEILSRNIIECISEFGSNMNYVDVNITTCWNASIPCGTVDNPQMTIQTRIAMPMVSINATQ